MKSIPHFPLATAVFGRETHYLGKEIFSSLTETLIADKRNRLGISALFFYVVNNKSGPNHFLRTQYFWRGGSNLIT